MRKTLLLQACMLLIAFMAYAQPQAVGHLTIFSEDGDKFYLILNGEKQNTTAQTNLRVEDLTQDYYTAKIIFEDQSIPEINKNFLPIGDEQNGKQDVTYKIKKNKNNGKVTLNYFSAVPVAQAPAPRSDVFVVHYGAPVPPPPATQTTTVRTTTTTVNNPAVVDINVPGINVTINDPVLSTSATTTTRTTTTSTSTTDYPNDPARRPVPAPTTGDVPTRAGCANVYGMSSSDFNSALGTIKNQGFDETKLKTAKQIAGANCLTTAQISQICQTFGFEQSKLDFAKYAYDFCTEPKNYFKINNVFGFSSSVEELTEYVQNRR